MATGSTREIKEVLKFAQQNGFELVRSSKHFILKKGPHTVSVSMSPSCQHGPKNAMRDLKKCLASS